MESNEREPVEMETTRSRLIAASAPVMKVEGAIRLAESLIFSTLISERPCGGASESGESQRAELGASISRFTRRTLILISVLRVA